MGHIPVVEWYPIVTWRASKPSPRPPAPLPRGPARERGWGARARRTALAMRKLVYVSMRLEMIPGIAVSIAANAVLALHCLVCKYSVEQPCHAKSRKCRAGKSMVHTIEMPTMSEIAHHGICCYRDAAMSEERRRLPSGGTTRTHMSTGQSGKHSRAVLMPHRRTSNR